MVDNEESGVRIGDGVSFVHLVPQQFSKGVADIHVKAGPFEGSIKDELLIDVHAFCTALQYVHERLHGTAHLSGAERFQLSMEGDSRGGVEVKVEIYGSHSPLSQLKFEAHIEQSFLPEIIRNMRHQFPDK